MLLDSGTPGFDALIAPGHVSTVMGPEEWEFVVTDHDIPAAVAGFTPDSLLAAMYSVLRQIIEKRPFLDNCYPQLVRPGGNPTALSTLETVMDVVDANWRGIGVIPGSGFALSEKYHALDARERFGIEPDEDRKRAGEMPPVAIAPAWCSVKSIQTNASSTVKPAPRANPSAPAWSPTKAPAAFGGPAEYGNDQSM